MAETKPAVIAPAEEVCNSLAARAQEFKKALPPQIPEEKFVRVAQTAVRMEPKLAACDRNTLYASFYRCAQDGLVPDGREAAIVPWGSTARYMPMVAGIMKKVRNSGEIGDIDAQIVHEHDTYRAWIDEKGRHFSFEKAKGDRGAPVLTFAYAVGKDGTFYFEEISEEEMGAIERMSKANDSPWKGPFKTEMKRKSALRRLAKYRLPQSTDLTNLTQTEDDIYDDPETKGPATPPEAGKPNRLRDLVVDKQTAQEAEIEFPGNGPKTEVPI
jgi:recombination protein RecT